MNERMAHDRILGTIPASHYTRREPTIVLTADDACRALDALMWANRQADYPGLSIHSDVAQQHLAEALGADCRGSANASPA